MARLRITSGPLAGQTVEIESELVIGRAEGDLAIEDLELSRRHVAVRRLANRLQVEDLGSSNGTFVDGTRIEEPTMVGGGAEIRVGTTVLVVEGVLPVTSSEEAEGTDRQATRISPVAPETSGAPPPPAAPPPAAPSPAAPSPALPQVPAAPLGVFHPPEHRRQRGLASRSWIPVALSFGTVILTAVALVIYFAAR
jgi:ABC transport system ATP-binding/permease protein